jgi:hypothetical protein
MPNQPSSPSSDAITCLTPFGSVQIDFPEGQPGAVIFGNEDASAFAERVIESCTDIDGMSLSLQAIEPGDLIEFCRAEGFVVLPPFPPDPIPVLPQFGNEPDGQAPDADNIGGQ